MKASFLAALLSGGVAIGALAAESEIGDDVGRVAINRADKARASAVVVVFNRPIVRFRAPVLGVPCCQKTASPAVPSPVPVS